MSGFSLWDVQKSLYERLTGDAALMALIAGVYDRVPERSVFPYLTIGDIAARDWSSKTTGGQRLAVAIHVYAESKGNKAAAEIMKRLHALLHEGTLAVPSQALVLAQVESAALLKEDEAEIVHGILRLVLLTHAA